ncbi:hypothetical protein D3C86_1819550 [compost metagenome]
MPSTSLVVRAEATESLRFHHAAKVEISRERSTLEDHPGGVRTQLVVGSDGRYRAVRETALGEEQAFPPAGAIGSTSEKFATTATVLAVFISSDRTFDESRPSIHHFAAALQGIKAAIGFPGLVFDDVS